MNAAPLGMHPDDPQPFDVAVLSTTTVVADIVTKPPITPFLKVARARAIATIDRIAMADAQLLSS